MERIEVEMERIEVEMERIEAEEKAAREAEEKRLAEETRVEEEKRIAKERRMEEQQRQEEEKRVAEEKRVVEEQKKKKLEVLAEKKRVEELRLAAAKRREEDRIAENAAADAEEEQARATAFAKQVEENRKEKEKAAKELEKWRVTVQGVRDPRVVKNWAGPVTPRGDMSWLPAIVSLKSPDVHKIQSIGVYTTKVNKNKAKDYIISKNPPDCPKPNPNCLELATLPVTRRKQPTKSHRVDVKIPVSTSSDEVVEQQQEVVPRGTKRKRPIKMIARNGKGNEFNEDSAPETASGQQESSSQPQPCSACSRCVLYAINKGNIAAGLATMPLVECEQKDPKPKMTSMRGPPRGLEKGGLKDQEKMLGILARRERREIEVKGGSESEREEDEDEDGEGEDDEEEVEETKRREEICEGKKRAE
ncbi:hypothetical protein GGU11DRAFT_859357 [Lentinula aff. detonsa]|nr:hypothetical protein GGU11DRAFT_859357 [Lentinula aff. detonsa]